MPLNGGIPRSIIRFQIPSVNRRYATSWNICYGPRMTQQDLGARLACQLGAWMSIVGFASVRTGISHAIGHQLGGHCHVPHGQTSCIMLPHAMEFNRPVAADRLALVAEAAGLETHRMTHRPNGQRRDRRHTTIHSMTWTARCACVTWG